MCKNTKFKIKISSAILSVLIVMMMPLSVFGTTHSLAVPKVKQSKTNWCWSACGTAVANYKKNSNITQYDFYKAATGKTDYQDIGKEPQDIARGLQYYGLTSIIKRMEKLFLRATIRTGAGSTVSLSPL